MARGRMISATLGGSRKFSLLTSNDARLIYCLLLAHADAYGRVEADPVYVRGVVLSRVPIDLDDIQRALEEMDAVGLIHLYAVDGFPYAEIIGFAEHNRTDAARESQTSIPDPDGVIPLRPARDKPVETESRPGHDSGTTKARAGRDSVRTKARPSPDLVRTESRPNTDCVAEKGKEKEEVEAEAEVLPPPTPPDGGNDPKIENEAETSDLPGTAPPERFDPLTVTLPEMVSPSVWAEFVAHRRELRKRLTARAVKQIVELLAEYPQDADEMLRVAIRSGWTGVFPLKASARRGGAPPVSASSALDQYRERGL